MKSSSTNIITDTNFIHRVRMRYGRVIERSCKMEESKEIRVKNNGV